MARERERDYEISKQCLLAREFRVGKFKGISKNIIFSLKCKFGKFGQNLVVSKLQVCQNLVVT